MTDIGLSVIPPTFVTANKKTKPMEHKNCQSCAMPLKKDPKKGGSNADGSTSTVYCSYCYENGHFVHPDITMIEMKQLVKSKMKEMGFPGFMAGFFTKGIPKLERWRNQ